MEDLARRLGTPRDVMGDFWSSRVFTSKACVLSDQQKATVGRDRNSEVLTTAETYRVFISVPKVLYPRSHIMVSREVRAAAKVAKYERAPRVASKKANVPEVLLGLEATQILRLCSSFYVSSARKLLVV